VTKNKTEVVAPPLARPHEGLVQSRRDARDRAQAKVNLERECTGRFRPNVSGGQSADVGHDPRVEQSSARGPHDRKNRALSLRRRPLPPVRRAIGCQNLLVPRLPALICQRHGELARTHGGDRDFGAVERICEDCGQRQRNTAALLSKVRIFSICKLIREAASYRCASGDVGRPFFCAPNNEHLV
jgi:hypothetical protein